MMDANAVLCVIRLVHDDPTLGPLEKAVATRVYLSMDAFGECFLSKRAIARIEGINRSSVKKAIDRLCEAGWLVHLEVGGTRYIYRLGPKGQGSRPNGQDVEKINQDGRKNHPPSGVRRMDMPRERTERIIAFLNQLQRQYDAACLSDMQSVTEQERRMWLAASEEIQEDIDVLVKHLSMYPPREDNDS